MHTVTKEKMNHLEQLSTSRQIINALAIDQRNSLKNMMNETNPELVDEEIIKEFKVLVSKELTKYASSILLDSQYGIDAANSRDEQSGLLISYEVSGYDKNEEGRFPRLLPDLSAKRIKELGANAVKILLYYDVDEPEWINDYKQVFVERVGSECVGEDIPYFLEIVSYDSKIEDKNSVEFAKVKPHKVIEPMKEFSKEKYNVDVLKVEVPVNMKFVEGFEEEDKIVHSKEEALSYYREQSKATHLPFIFLSAGVSAELFIETIKFAKKAGSEFSGVLCGRATWKDSVPVFVDKGAQAANKWLSTKGKENINDLSVVVEESATPITKRVQLRA